MKYLIIIFAVFPVLLFAQPFTQPNNSAIFAPTFIPRVYPSPTTETSYGPELFSPPVSSPWQWRKISYGRWAGFGSSYKLSEGRTKGCDGYDNKASYLRTEGGLCRVGYILYARRTDYILKVDSLEKLKEVFGPVDSEAEAVSFVTSVIPDLQFVTSRAAAGYERLVGYTLPIDGGYLVQTLQKNTFGCGDHKPTGVMFKVTDGGDVQKIASEKPKPPRGDVPILCID